MGFFFFLLGLELLDLLNFIVVALALRSKSMVATST